MRRDPRHIISFLTPWVNLQKLITKTGQKLVLPFYHAVNDRPGPHLKHLYRIKSRQEFLTDLDKLCNYFEPLSPEIFLQKELKLYRPGFVLSFDDGLKEVYDIIAPVLLEKGIPAIFFLNNGFIDNKALFYRYKASLLVEQIRSSEWRGIRTLELPWAENISNRSPDSMITYILGLQYHETEILDELCDNLGLNIPAYLGENSPYMTSSEIMELKNKGFYLGAHSFDHPQFSALDMQEQKEEILRSTADIRKRFELDYSFFSFPFSDFGVEKSLTESLFTETDKPVDAIFGTAGLKKVQLIPHFQRLSMEKYYGDSEQILRMEYFYYSLKKLIQ